jgi:hypothetical protein
VVAKPWTKISEALIRAQRSYGSKATLAMVGFTLIPFTILPAGALLQILDTGGALRCPKFERAQQFGPFLSKKWH